MQVIKHQSSILSDQELQLLVSDLNENQQTNYKIYSYRYHGSLTNCQLLLSDSIEQLILMLSASPRGSAVLLPENVESEVLLNKLLALLFIRADIYVFWLGKLPSMETNLTDFIHCQDESLLKHNITLWQNYIQRSHREWLAHYSVAFITESEKNKTHHQQVLSTIGLEHVDFYNAQTALTKITTQKLLIIDIDVFELRIVDILKRLSNQEKFPIVIIYGQQPDNVCRASYAMIESLGFPILASLSSIPNDAQWHKLFSSLFAKVYLKLWVHEEHLITGAYPIYALETQSIVSYFCMYGMTQKQIFSLTKTNSIRHIINLKSLKDWFPDGIKKEVRTQLAQALNCDKYHIDICVQEPENIQMNSVIFATLVLARLSKARIYWFIENERNLSADIIKNYPISDIILSESISHMLLTEPSKSLLDFLEQAQQQQVNLIATLQPNKSSCDALALYGIEYVLNKQCYIGLIEQKG